MGLTYPDRTKKLAFYTIKRLIRLFNTGTIAVADDELSVEATQGNAGDLYSHLFMRPDGRQVLIVWDKDASPVRIKLKRKGSHVTEYALNGTGAPYPDFEGTELRNVHLSIGEARVFEILP